MGLYHALLSLGEIPLVLLVFLPRIAASYAIVMLGQLCRRLAAVFASATSTYKQKANLRILIITDYMPPQTHGIAVRFQQYIENMRKMGHEVQVFSTNIIKERESSFDHPNMPAIVNPWNTANKMAYNPGFKLAWFLGAKQWDVVHVVYPSLLSLAILPVCNWRRLPVYCSHHVDMEFYVREYMRSSEALQRLGHVLLWLSSELPAAQLACVNAAPTLCFLNSHIPQCVGARRRIPSGVVDSRFKVDSDEQLLRERRELLERCGADANGCVGIMVQRLAPEKDTMHALVALRQLGDARGGRQRGGGGKFSLDGTRPFYLVVAGDGPSRAELEEYAASHGLPVTFLGNLRNDQLPPLYRAADLFVTCSASETYGLTVLEALACGTPVALPHCDVFDELWAHRVPPSWFYEHGDVDGLIRAMVAAGSLPAKEKLRKAPIKASWADATVELVAQYEQMVKDNLPYRRELATYTTAFNHFVRAMLVAAALWLLMRAEARLINRGLVALLSDISR